ncbi:MAG: NAD(P)/FAD-dependent oxidoreductase [Pseudoclavibacter sp.]
MNSTWDAIVIGAGAAGLSAALMLGRARRHVLVIDSGEPRNRFATNMHGVLGSEGLPPTDLTARGRSEAELYGIEFVDGSVATVREPADRPDALEVLVTPSAGETQELLVTRTIVVATGVSDELPDIPGLARHWGSTVLHCPYCHGWEVRDQRLGIIANGPVALHMAQLVRQWSPTVTLFTDVSGFSQGDLDALTARGIRTMTPVAEVFGDDHVTGVRLHDDAMVELDALFVQSHMHPLDACVADLGLDRAEAPFGMGSFLHTDPMGNTSHPRVWAAGNVSNPAANVPISIGSGATVGAAVNAALVQWEVAVAAAAAAA